ncbi:MAG: class I SAM-dependent methyltransferase [Candidatus Delongbacteria bacterium]|nr:class I SAM-dependent methyltransferase [Candidatus Delongbacteria bacterium]
MKTLKGNDHTKNKRILSIPCTLVKKFKILSAFRSTLKEHEKIILWKIFGKKIKRNQWNNKESSSLETYRKLMLWSWEETKSNAPEYFERLNFTVSKCRGKVLEIGCGIGTMARWLSKSEKVKEIIAIDAFSEAIEELKRNNLPKVIPLKM